MDELEVIWNILKDVGSNSDDVDVMWNRLGFIRLGSYMDDVDVICSRLGLLSSYRESLHIIVTCYTKNGY